MVVGCGDPAARDGHNQCNIQSGSNAIDYLINQCFDNLLSISVSELHQRTKDLMACWGASTLTLKSDFPRFPRAGTAVKRGPRFNSRN